MGQFLSPSTSGHLLSSSLLLVEIAPCCRCWLVRLLVSRWRVLCPGLSHGSWKETTTVDFFFAWTLKVAWAGRVWGSWGKLWDMTYA